MYVIASLLNPAATQQTQLIWDLLETKCGLMGIKLTPLPHFSWVVSEEFDLARVETEVRMLAQAFDTFYAETTGLGIFTGENPVLHTSLVKTRRLLEMQERIWRSASSCAVRLSPYYEPSSWMPHITLAYRDITRENLGCAVQEIAFRDLNMKVLVDHLALIYEVEGQIGIKFRYDFGKTE